MRFKKEIIDASKHLLQLQFNIGSEGNISYRQKNEIYITPSGIKTSNLEPKYISKVEENEIKKVIDGGGNIENYKKLHKYYTFPYEYGRHKYHIACKKYEDTNVPEIIGFYNSSKGSILYINECKSIRVLNEILSELTQNNYNLERAEKNQIPYKLKNKNSIHIGENKVGILDDNGDIKFN